MFIDTKLLDDGFNTICLEALQKVQLEKCFLEEWRKKNDNEAS
jgi:hypothetical protein